MGSSSFALPSPSSEGLMVFSLMWLFFVILIIWSIVWKAVALWKAARNGQKGWFIVLSIVNTAGILEMIYVLYVSRRQQRTLSSVNPKPNAPVA